MSQTNLDHLDQQQDDDSHPRDTYTPEDEARMLALWEQRQAQQRAMSTELRMAIYNAKVTAMICDAAFGKRGA